MLEILYKHRTMHKSKGREAWYFVVLYFSHTRCPSCVDWMGLPFHDKRTSLAYFESSNASESENFASVPIYKPKESDVSFIWPFNYGLGVIWEHTVHLLLPIQIREACVAFDFIEELRFSWWSYKVFCETFGPWISDSWVFTSSWLLHMWYQYRW